MSSAQALLALQAADQELNTRRRAYRKVLQDLGAQGGLPDLRDKAEKSKVGELEARVEHAKMESELATLKDRLAHLEERLYSGAITNVKELQAVETEHAAARKQYVSVEQGLGPTLAASQEAKGRHEALDRQLTELEDSWKTTGVQLTAERNRLAKEVGEMARKRTAAAAVIPPTDLTFYESLLSRKAGIAVVTVERGVCQGCRVKLPIKEISRMRVSNGLITCSSCGRILLTM